MSIFLEIVSDLRLRMNPSFVHAPPVLHRDLWSSFRLVHATVAGIDTTFVGPTHSPASDWDSYPVLLRRLLWAAGYGCTGVTAGRSFTTSAVTAPTWVKSWWPPASRASFHFSHFPNCIMNHIWRSSCPFDSWRTCKIALFDTLSSKNEIVTFIFM